MSTQVDLNNVNCLVTKNHVGYDTIMNICTNTSVNVSWTGLDWAAAILVTLFIVALLAVTAGMMWTIITD